MHCYLAGLIAVLAGLAARSTPAGSLTVDDLTVYGTHTVTQEVTQGEMPTNTAQQELWYRFNVEEDPVTDHSTNSHSGTVNGADWTSAGRIDGACDFNGSSDYISCGTLSMGSGSVCSWVKLDSQPSGDHSVFGLVESSNVRYWRLRYAGDKVSFIYRTSSGHHRIWNSVDDYSHAGSWHHLAAVFDASSLSLDFYVDGEEISMSCSSSGSPSGTITQPAAVGRAGGYNGYFIDGLVDEVLLYNSCLSSNEVHDLYLYNGTNFASAALAVHSSAAFNSNPTFTAGIEYVKPLGDVEMGIYTNKP